MTDTAQPATAAETEVVSREDAIAAAAQAFKTFNPDAEAAPERLRGPDGKFVSPNAEEAGEDEEIEAADDATDPDGAEAEAGAESDDEEQDESEAADEAQHKDPTMPESWPADKAELWEALTPDAQAFIRQRDADQKAAVNAKFMEAANVRKAHEAEIAEAQSNRQAYADAVEQVLSLVVPQPPSLSMLDINSGDYDPDTYHLRKAQYENTTAYLQQHKAQLENIRAQESLREFHALNNATREGLLQEVPDIADEGKAPAIFNDLIGYAVSLGIPVETFQAPTSAVEWRVLWKAQQYDRLQAAKAKVRTDPKPEPRKAQPAVRPGVTTPRRAIEQANTSKAMDRLRREGSVDAGAAALKQLMKGHLS